MKKSIIHIILAVICVSFFSCNKKADISKWRPKRNEAAKIKVVTENGHIKFMTMETGLPKMDLVSNNTPMKPNPKIQVKSIFQVMKDWLGWS